MAKAVLVTDMPEQVCQKCTLCYETEDDEYLCCAVGKLVPDGAKPDWCPLRELPERMEICGTYNAEYYAKGGLMTVPMTAVKMHRYGKGCELNPDYFRDGVGYLQAAENEVDEPTLFDFMPEVLP